MTTRPHVGCPFWSGLPERHTMDKHAKLGTELALKRYRLMRRPQTCAVGKAPPWRSERENSPGISNSYGPTPNSGTCWSESAEGASSRSGPVCQRCDCGSLRAGAGCGGVSSRPTTCGVLHWRALAAIEDHKSIVIAGNTTTPRGDPNLSSTEVGSIPCARHHSRRSSGVSAGGCAGRFASIRSILRRSDFIATPRQPCAGSGHPASASAPPWLAHQRADRRSPAASPTSR